MTHFRPDPVITWWLSDSFIGSAAHLSHKVGNITRSVLMMMIMMMMMMMISRSVLTFTPRPGDDGRVLTCRAENTMIKDGALQDAWKLTVYCEF